MKRLTRRIVAPLCVGSSPTTRPIFFYLKTGIPGEIGTGSLIWGYRQAVRQRTLTPLSVVRLHLPLPVIKSCRQPSAGFFAWAGRTAARLPLIAYCLLLIAYCYPLTASQSFCIGRAIKGRSFYVQIKDQLRPTWRSYAGPPQQRRISVPPYASLADKSRSALFYNAPVRAPPKPSEPSGRQAGPS